MTETWLERNWNRLKKVVATLHPGHKLARQPLPHVPDEVLRIPITCQHCSNQTNKHKNTTPVWNLPQRWRSHTRPAGQPEEVHVFLHEPAARFHSLILLGLDHSSPRRWIQIQPTQACRRGRASWWILNLSSLICPHSDTPPYSAKFPDPLWPWTICSFQSADYPGNNCQTQNSLFITWCGYLGSDQDRWTILGLARQVARRAPDTWGQTSNNRQGASKQEPALLTQQTKANKIDSNRL